MTRILMRNCGFVEREVEGQFFLIDEESSRIHHLNETASAIWRLLAEPATSNRVIEMFRFLYPDENVRDLKRSIRSILGDLMDRNILVRKRKWEAD